LGGASVAGETTSGGASVAREVTSGGASVAKEVTSGFLVVREGASGGSAATVMGVVSSIELIYTSIIPIVT
jgi:hypothetical protein